MSHLRIFRLVQRMAQETSFPSFLKYLQSFFSDRFTWLPSYHIPQRLSIGYSITALGHEGQWLLSSLAMMLRQFQSLEQPTTFFGARLTILD